MFWSFTGQEKVSNRFLLFIPLNCFLLGGHIKISTHLSRMLSLTHLGSWSSVQSSWCRTLKQISELRGKRPFRTSNPKAATSTFQRYWMYLNYMLNKTYYRFTFDATKITLIIYYILFGCWIGYYFQSPHYAVHIYVLANWKVLFKFSHKSGIYCVLYVPVMMLIFMNEKQAIYLKCFATKTAWVLRYLYDT